MTAKYSRTAEQDSQQDLAVAAAAASFKSASVYECVSHLDEKPCLVGQVGNRSKSSPAVYGLIGSKSERVVKLWWAIRNSFRGHPVHPRSGKRNRAEFGFRFKSSDCDGLVQNLVQTSAERAPF